LDKKLNLNLKINLLFVRMEILSKKRRKDTTTTTIMILKAKRFFY